MHVCASVDLYLQAHLRQGDSHTYGPLGVRQLQQKTSAADLSAHLLTSAFKHLAEGHFKVILGLRLVTTHIIFVAKVDAADLHLQVFDHLSGQFLHEGVLLLLLMFLCKQAGSNQVDCQSSSRSEQPVNAFA